MSRWPKLRDPSSAQFSGLSVVKVGGSPYALCGYVNGKNGFGGYAGPQRFHITLADERLIISPSREERGNEDYSNYDSMFDALCGNGAAASHARDKIVSDVMSKYGG